MLQTLLTDRFRLQVHHVQKDLPVYNLVVNRGGPKLRESPAGTKSTANVRARGNRGIHMEATGMTMSNLVDNQLSGYSGRPVFDKTGLTGSFDFTLDSTSRIWKQALRGPRRPFSFYGVTRTARP